MAVITDPEGATSRSGSRRSTSARRLNEAGRALLERADDARRRGRAEVLHEALRMDGESQSRIHRVAHGEKAIGGILEMNGEMFENVPPNWMPYFCVADCDATVKKAKSLGGADACQGRWTSRTSAGSRSSATRRARVRADSSEDVGKSRL